MKFQSHVPNFIDAEPTIQKQDFTSVSDLLNHEWIKGWSKGKEDFAYYWSPNKGRWSKAILMAMWKEKGKYTWWVLGYMDEIPDNLPEWKAP